jgi:hypothetical protein
VSKVLVVHDGKRERELLLVERLVVGRDPMCDLSHDDSLLSRRHAEFATSGDEVTVRDLGSRNGLFVNGTRTAERALKPGDIVTIGPLRVRYVQTAAPISLTPDELDIDVTKVISGGGPKPPATVTAPAMVAPAFPEPEEEEEEEEDVPEDEVTRVVQAADLVPGMPDANEDDLDGAEATMLVNSSNLTGAVADVPASTPRPAAVSPGPGTLVLPTPAAPRPPDPVVREPSGFRPVTPTPVRAPASLAPPLPSEPVIINAGTLTGFVFVLLAALASVVFIASAAPLIMWRGDDSQAEGLASLLRWPVLPIIIAMATTYVVATLVNRRFVETLMALQGTESGGVDPSGGSPQG